jgi:hypothetical protein
VGSWGGVGGGEGIGGNEMGMRWVWWARWNVWFFSFLSGSTVLMLALLKRVRHLHCSSLLQELCSFGVVFLIINLCS